MIAGDRRYSVTGTGYVPEGELRGDGHPVVAAEHPALWRLLRAASLANESSLAMDDGSVEGWVWSGDPTDVALLGLALKADMDPGQVQAEYEPLAMIPFEPERRYPASFNTRDGDGVTSVKGAPERVLAICDHELDLRTGQLLPLEQDRWDAAVEQLILPASASSPWRLVASARTRRERGSGRTPDIGWSDRTDPVAPRTRLLAVGRDDPPTERSSSSTRGP